MAVIHSSLRKMLGPDNIVLFRQVLYNRELSPGAKCLWIAINDSPNMQVKKKTIFAKRFGTSPSSVTRWIKELKKEGFMIRGKKNQA